MSDTVHMLAPKGTRSATIEGHQYTISDGKVKVVNEAHIPTLRLHGFTETDAEDKASLLTRIEETDDKDWLVTFIEEHGGEADTSISMKKLRRQATALLEEDSE